MAQATPTIAASPVVPTPTAVASPIPQGPPDVRIVGLNFDGIVPNSESDEWIAVQNFGGAPVNLAGWRIYADDPGQDFSFPSFDLQPGQGCRVYTNEYHPETCGFSFGRGSAIWANQERECGYLYRPDGSEASSWCY